MVMGLFFILAQTGYGWGAGPVHGNANTPAPNPYLSAPLYGITHFDSAQTDCTPYGPPKGIFQVDPATRPIAYGGLVNIMTLAATDPDYMWAVGTDHVAYVRCGSGQWESVAFKDAPAYVIPSLLAIPATTQKAFGEMSAVGMSIAGMDAVLQSGYGINYNYRLVNGTYSVCDLDNVVYANFGFGVYAFGLTDAADPSKGITVLRKIDDLGVVSGSSVSSRVFGLSMTYDGRLILVFQNGLAVIDRSLDLDTSHYYAFGNSGGNPESVSNSVAVDEDNGIYVATNQIMRKLVWTGEAISDKEADGAWASAYDAPAVAPPVIKFENGTGSTPTLMGFGKNTDRLVVITDGAKQMKLVAFWRDSIPEDFVQQPGTASRRIAGQIQVTCGFSPLPEWIQSEQSVVVNRDGAFVVNNIPADTTDLARVSRNKMLVVTLMGPAFDTSMGVERFQWDKQKHAWSSVWTRSDVSSTSMIPIYAKDGNMVLVNGYTDENGWEVTGMDWDTGHTVHQTFLGRQNFGNGAYAILEYLRNGDLLFNSIAGVLRVNYDK